MLRDRLNEKIYEIQAGIFKVIDLIYEILEFYVSLDRLHSMSDFKKENFVSEFRSTVMQTTSLCSMMDEEIGKLFLHYSLHGKELRLFSYSLRMMYEMNLMVEEMNDAFEYLRNIENDNELFIHRKEEWISRLVELVKKLIYQFVEVYSYNDRDFDLNIDQILANATNLDEEIDQIYATHLDTLTELTKISSIPVEQFFEVTSAIRSFERCGDHLCNIIEQSIFIQTKNKVKIT